MKDYESLSDQVVEFVMTCKDEMLRKLTVSSLASRFHVDRSHLAREFKSDKKVLLSKFLQKEKMARAVLLLKDANDLTIEKLSEQLGFCSVEYFRKVFKEHFAITPTKYRALKNRCLHRLQKEESVADASGKRLHR